MSSRPSTACGSRPELRTSQLRPFPSNFQCFRTCPEIFHNISYANHGPGLAPSGNGLGVGTRFAGPAASLLFVHGANDPLVSLASSKDAFNKAPWPKAFLTLPGEDHAKPYLDPTNPSWDVVAETTTDFLRWSLYGDSAAKKRLGADAGHDGLGVLDDRL